MAEVEGFAEQPGSESAPQPSAQRLLLALQATRTLLWEWDPLGERLITTPTLAEAFGAPSVTSLTEGFALIHPEDLPRHQATVEAVLEGGGSYHSEYRIVRPDNGAIVWLEERAAADLDAAGRVTRLHGVSVDVTERKRVEEALRESEERLQLALHAGRMGAWQWDIRTNRVHWSPSLEAIHGLETGSFGGTFEDYQRDIHPDDREYVLQTIARSVSEGDEHYLHYRIIRPDGEVRWLEARGRQLFDVTGRLVALTGVCVDATERKRAEEAVELLAEVGRTLSDTFDSQTTLHQLGRLLASALADVVEIHLAQEAGAFRRAVAVHRDPGQQRLLEAARPSPVPGPDGADPLLEVARTGEPVFRPEIPDSRLASAPAAEHDEPTSALAPMSLIVVPLNAHGRTLGSLSLARLKGSRAFDEQDLQLAEQLGRRIGLALDNARLYRAEQEARARAEEALQSRDDFIAVVAHELRNPLTAALSHAQLMKRRGAYNEQLLERMIDATHRLSRLIDDLTDASQLAREQLTLQPERFDLTELVRASAEEAQQTSPEHRVQVQAPPTPIEGRWDRDRLGQVLSNLLSNAIKYSPEGGEVIVSVEATAGDARVSIRDRGVGIPEPARARLFDRFYRVEDTAAQAPGLGLGLFVTRSLIEAHGGQIWAESDGPGQGSTFTFTLPLD